MVLENTRGPGDKEKKIPIVDRVVLENTTLSTIGFFYYCRQGGIFQYHPVDNSKKKFPIVDRVVLDNTDPLIKGKKYFGILILKNEISLFSPNYNANTVSMARRYCVNAVRRVLTH